ncbi:MAG: DNA-3-methyladenine glycosylase [Lactobacillus sp.]|jgi:DNA-3-methyladenine glycosylase|nr:DNA-3-methyladenine glycosylase [Lactobacillus sp.]
MDYKDFFQKRTTATIARDLLGHALTFQTPAGKVGGLIVETEAYVGVRDRAAHSYGGRRSPANEGLYRAGGTLYIYAQRQYFFFDVATQAAGTSEGVLVRAIEPIWGQELMLANRHGKGGRLLTNGPAKMMQAFGITSRKWDLHLLADSPFEIDLQHKRAPKQILALPRIGVVQADPIWANKPLRFVVAGNPYVSDIKQRQIEKDHGWA